MIDNLTLLIRDGSRATRWEIILSKVWKESNSRSWIQWLGKLGKRYGFKPETLPKSDYCFTHLVFKDEESLTFFLLKFGDPLITD